MKRHRPIMPIPVRLRRDLVRRLGYGGSARILGVYWHRPRECVVLFDGASYKRASSDRPFVALCEQLEDWCREKKVRLQPPRSAPSHWLLLDLVAGEVFVAGCRIARKAVVDQRFPEEAEVGKQKRLPF